MARTSARTATRKSPTITPDRERRIRERAYHLWEADGKPHGRDVTYWERACELIGNDEPAASEPGSVVSPPARKPRARAKPPSPD